MTDVTDVTRILNAIEKGDAKAIDGLLPLIYEEFRLLAARKLPYGKSGQTLQAPAVVHEGCLRPALDEWSRQLERQEPVITWAVKLLLYVGLALEQAARILEISTRGAIRCWTYAQAWLYKEMNKS